MVIGYGFSDRHVNKAIVEAWRNGSLTGMFLADPAGRAVLNPTRNHAIRQRRISTISRAWRVHPAYQRGLRRGRI
jgi:hypothetical protein